MYTMKVPHKINTDYGTLDSEVMKTKTVETIMNVLTETKSNNKVRKVLLSYYKECVKADKEYKDLWKNKQFGDN